MNSNDILEILKSEDPVFLNDVFDRAYEVKLAHVGNKVYLRGIIEFSNVCEKDCFYCGIRRSNYRAPRFSMPQEEIIEAALFAHRSGYGSIVLQSGERTDEKFVKFIEEVLIRIKKDTCNTLGITLSLGEQTKGTAKRWFDAGAHRYLLRIETSNKQLYQKLHPADHNFNNRMDCLDYLRETGYQVGTGVMIGLPGQTPEDLAGDVLFFKEKDIDMIGMGPYIPHANTPLSAQESAHKDNYLLGLKMIAVTRLYLKDVNIAATTALQALSPRGREDGLRAGANIIMPNITPVKYRDAYQLYDGKPCIDENASACRACLEKRVASIHEAIGYNERGDSPHFFKREKKKNC